MRHATGRAFEDTQIGQSTKSLRSSDQFHELSTARAPLWRQRGIVRTHDEDRFMVATKRGARQLADQKGRLRQKATVLRGGVNRGGNLSTTWPTN
jgi:hypothetical protein